MGYEIDFLGVGEESKSGDAIAVRFGNLHGARNEQQVVVIDGGFVDNGEDLVKHLQSHYQTEKVDILINTHPDGDHIGGLKTVLESMVVTELWIHQPWLHIEGMADKFVDGRLTDKSIGDRLKDYLEKSWELVKLADAKGTIVRDPFTGLTDKSGSVRVLGPEKDYYLTLLPDFEGMPTAKKSETVTNEDSMLEKLGRLLSSIFATWGEDKIKDDGETSAKNNTSVITQIIVDDRRLIFTGDAGIPALDAAADEVDACTSSAELRFIQVPHHGSRRNIGPSVLNRLVGEPIVEGEGKSITAIASTAKKAEPKHPRKAVLNAFTHRGVRVLATRGKGICHSHESPDREGWSSLSPEPYHYEYTEEA